MARIRSQQEIEQIRSKVMLAAATLFLQKGFDATTVKDISALSQVPQSVIYYEIKSKDEILSEIVRFVIRRQFERTDRLLENMPHSKIQYYAAETTLQLYMAESSELIRGLYMAAYSLPKTTDIIQHTLTAKLEDIFKEHLPDLETKDFYELEIASGGIMRGFLTVPCDMYFTMERKVKRFLETTFLVYQVPREEINGAIEFVSQFDFKTLAKETIDNMMETLYEYAQDTTE